jgi:hypothetical protein
MGSFAYLASQNMKTAKTTTPRMSGTSTGAEPQEYVTPPQLSPSYKYHPHMVSDIPESKVTHGPTRRRMEETMVSAEPT